MRTRTRTKRKKIESALCGEERSERARTRRGRRGDEGFKFGGWVLGQTQDGKKEGKILFASWFLRFDYNRRFRRENSENSENDPPAAVLTRSNGESALAALPSLT